jgi:hypothetical protein
MHPGLATQLLNSVVRQRLWNAELLYYLQEYVDVSSIILLTMQKMCKHVYDFIILNLLLYCHVILMLANVIVTMILFQQLLNSIYTIKKAKSDAVPKHLWNGKFRHPPRSIGKIRHQHRLGRSIYVDGGFFRPMHVSGLRHAWLFNSVMLCCYASNTIVFIIQSEAMDLIFIIVKYFMF